MTAQLTWFALFAVVMYFIVTDESIAAAFYYVIKLGQGYIQRQWWWLLHNPRNPVVKYMMWRRSEKLAQELMDEFKNK
mgnify:CR=1 FL=1|jgi:hypothetical protein